MVQSAPIATVFGGSGFVGRYITQALARAGFRVRVAVRRPNEALFVRTYGVVGQVEPMQANIRDEASTARAVAGAEVVVNCVGILFADGKNGFDAVQDEGAGRIARLSAEAGVQRFVQISAIGANAESDSIYARTKAAGEAAVLEHMPNAVILRPSIVFGPEDGFFNRFAGMSRLGPVLPVVGAETKFQPVYVDDVADAAAKAARGEAEPGVYELGGPEVESFRALMERMLKIIRRRRLLAPVPMWIARFQGRMLDLLPYVTFGIVPNSLLTQDQVKLLAVDNVVSDGARSFADLGITPRDMDAILESYLYCYRPKGQFTALSESAKNLR
ncbi:MAG: complex I NDUFA9 subunit family protein [Pseudomonadota bacterium]